MEHSQGARRYGLVLGLTKECLVIMHAIAQFQEFELHTSCIAAHASG